VPATDVEALTSTLMGLFEKRRARKFFIYVQDYDESDPKSHEGLDLNKVTAREVISYAILIPFTLFLTYVNYTYIFKQLVVHCYLFIHISFIFLFVRKEL
jgi:GDP dissociation inhibitor